MAFGFPSRVKLSRSRLALLAFACLLGSLYFLTPYDSPVRSFFRFHTNAATNYIRHKYPGDAWIGEPPKYPVDFERDVGIVVKTGYGTRARVPHVLEALSGEGLNGDMIVVRDYPKVESDNFTLADGRPVPSLDIIDWMLEKGKLGESAKSDRVEKYLQLVQAVKDKNWAIAEERSKRSGWELDALKFISSFEYVWETMSRKKWYIMADDDTYIIKESLGLLLSHVNPAVPQYLGNPVGDYKGRFAHGGSSALVSGATLQKLFENPHVVTEAHRESTTITWGDKLLSTTLMKVGVYLDEKYSLLFNGEPPHMTKIWAERFCRPVVSFHGLSSAELMDEVGDKFKDLKAPFFWRQLRSVYSGGAFSGGSSYESFVSEPIRANVDFVGRTDEHSETVPEVATADECIKICDQHATKCLAWTWLEDKKECIVAPWTLIGEEKKGVMSGINAAFAKRLEESCPSMPSQPGGAMVD